MAAPRSPLRYTPSTLEWATAQLVAEPPSWVRRSFLYALLGLLAVGLVYAALAQTAVVVEAKGTLVPSRGAVPIRPTASFEVQELRVAENSTVAAGALLVLSEDSVPAAEEEQLRRDTATLRSILAKDKAHDCPRCQAELEELSDHAFLIEGSAPVRDKLVQIRQLLKELVTARRAFVGRGATAASAQHRIAVAKGKLAEIERRNATELLGTRVEQLNSEIVAAKSELADREQAVRLPLERSKNVALAQLEEISAILDRYRGQQRLVAPVAGTVVNLKVRGKGQLVTAGETLLELIPADATIIAGLDVQNKDISQVQRGMEVRVKLDALPEREFGPVLGAITELPVGNAAGLEPTTKEDAYRVLATLDRQAVLKEGRPFPLRIGMSLKALIVVRYESILRRGARLFLGLGDGVTR
ncbi:MAG: HlyD family efflux transporter periplasmic adaptor subunit [Myxococcota bacterium]